MLLYYLALPFIYFISLLPFRALYAISDFMYFMVFHVFGYRRKVVEQNLRNSFPEKSEEEIIQLSKKYFRYMCDLILESLKKLTINQKEALEHCSFVNTDIFKKLYAENRSCILMMGHYGNWEWAGSTFSLSNEHQLYVVYKPLSNGRFESLMCKTRTMFGTKLIKMENTLRDMISNKNNCAAYAFIADQTPSPQHAYWTPFLNQDTPLFTGAEKIARKLNFPLVFVNIVRVKRGYYKIDAEMLCEEPKNTKDNEITEAYIRRLEKEIIKMPEIWLWSHRRWKHKRPVSVEVS
jgi:Kdo2-lipid IVA lauroyltransferase/acyltransferase